MSYKSQSDLYLEDNISKYPAIELLCKPILFMAEWFEISWKDPIPNDHICKEVFDKAFKCVKKHKSLFTETSSKHIKQKRGRDKNFYFLHQKNIFSL